MRLRSRYADIRAVVAVFLVGLTMSWPAGDLAEETPPLAAKPTDTNPPKFLRQRPSRLANHLAGEASPYLQLHVHNPVDWYPWGEEALARARVESKPIFLSVGYSTCYWCHVMERKVFSNPEIAALMNKYFINIKVDREERPDLDEIYMKAAHLLTGTGGWPNSIFLTPETKPFFAGSYFPPTDNYGRPGFPKVLRAISSLWVEDRDRVLTIASEVSRALAKRSEIQPTGNDLPQPDVLLEAARVQLSATYESQHGGFSSRTKFARPSTLDVLLVSYERTHDANTLAMVTKTLDEMALGGVHDHLAGGFHRYSTEPTWSVPHFEKMLYDNAQLIGVYARAYRMTQRPLYRQVVQDIVDYLEREMMHPDGGFYSAQDAEVDSQEGASYVWSRAEIGAVLGPGKASAFLSFYELVSVREPPGKGVLRIKLAASAALGCDGRTDLAERIERFAPHRAQLLAARNQRDQPFRDEKVLAGWNGLAIRDLVAAAEILNQPEYIRTAERAAHFVLGRLGTPQGGLHRSYVAGQAREEGVLNDYAFLADGLLALHRATSDPRWLERAASLVDTMLDRFEDPERGGFYFSVDDPSLLLRPKTFEDSVLPSGNAVALHVLRLLANLSDKPRYQQAATRAARLLAIPLDQIPSAMGTAIVTLASTEPSQRPILVSAEGGEPASGLRSPPRLPRSEDHVAVHLERDPKRPLDIIVRLVIDDGWHVNANPASLPFLIPTRIELDDALKPAPVHYPPGKAFHPAFSEETLSVYEGSIAITTTLGESPQRASPPVVVRYQACDHARCLPPAVSHLRLVESPQ